MTIWVVRLGDDLYVRSVYGRTNDQIDAAYRAKYHRYAASIINSIVSAAARSATIKLVPRPTSA